MPDLETAEMETPELESSDLENEGEDSPELEATDLEREEVETSEPEVELDTTAVDTVEIEPVEVEEAAPADAAEASEPATPVEDATGTEESDQTEATDGEDETAPVTVSATSPYDMPGDWYVIHSYSGYENKVKANLETRIQSMHMEDRIFEVHIPMEDVVEFKGGKKVTVPKKVFPGYILVRMTLDDDSWYAVRNTPGVTGFVAGNAQKPTPLSRREVERFLGVQEEEEKAKPRFKPEWEVGEQVRVVTGPFADFNGVIEDMNVDQQKIVVLVNIFGRDTPVELGFEDIQKS
jgi:transcriptional antiterminator NusG